MPFASAETKSAFDADPAALLPQFGGFCALGVFKGKKLDGDVRYAVIDALRDDRPIGDEKLEALRRLPSHHRVRGRVRPPRCPAIRKRV